MSISTRFRRLLPAAAVVLAGLGSATAAQAAPDAPDVPPEVAIGDGYKVFLVGHATGVQVYRCTSSGDAYTWAFVGPVADLFDGKGRLIATHFGGPTWQARDGSSVRAARVDGVTVDPTAIPWLKLAATSTTAGADGDRLTATAFIQRTATTGGLAPAAASCNEDTEGSTAEVPYTADYHFWKSTGA
jgi:hypothetical protein